MAFAKSEDVAARLGRSLAESEGDQVTFLLDAATAIIEEAVDKTEADLGDDAPTVLRFVCVEMVTRAMANPQGLASQQEALGAYSHGERFQGDGSGLMLKPLEVQMIRRAVWGQLSGTAQMESLASDLCVLCGMAPSLSNGEWICGCEDS